MSTVNSSEFILLLSINSVKHLKNITLRIDRPWEIVNLTCLLLLKSKETKKRSTFV